MNDKPVNILITVDDNYIQHAAVMITSLLGKTSKYINLYLMYCELSAQNIEKFKNFIMRYKNVKTFNPIYVDLKKYLDKPPIKSYLTKTTYLRILAPYFINDNYVIYLDPDLILLDDISKILDEVIFNLETPFLYAVESCVNHKIKLGLTAEEPTFCGGIMVLNLKSMRKLNIPEKCIKFIIDNENIIVGPLDDSLNVIVKSKWKPLNPKWNVYYKMIYNFEVYTSQSICYTKQEIKNAINKPSIVHFTGPIKPWHYIDKHPYKKYYWEYLKKTPWKNYKPSDKNFKNFLKKYFIDFIKLRKSIIKFWKHYFTRKKFIRLNKLLYELGLHGIGIKNFNKDMIITGETNFIKNYFKDCDKGIVFDVGAFVGNYSKKILDITKKVEIYAFEANPKNYEKLKNNINNKRFHPYNVAVGNYNSYIDLFD
ncbi:MAG: FkbM family methyltransferase, partial [Deferribacterota bacterium]|nr:FkbM family methyltransferase [Deferribacterota bacterium]